MSIRRLALALLVLAAVAACTNPTAPKAANSGYTVAW